MSGNGQALDTDKITLQTILQLGYETYARMHALPDYVRRAVWALLACRTARLGGHVQACPDGHIERIWYNSCRHRMCPQCAWLQIERWVAKQKARWLACDHYHVSFTMPHALNELWVANVAVMTQLLFASVHATLFELLRNAKYLGAQPGMIATRSGLPWHRAPRGAGIRRATPQGWGPPGARHSTRALRRSASINERVRG
jgi:Transposase zinc-binding domain